MLTFECYISCRAFPSFPACARLRFALRCAPLQRSGSVCLDVINQSWSPMYDLTNIFEVFLPQLLTYPNPTDPLNGEAAALQMREPERYKQKVIEYVHKYAKPEDFPTGDGADGENDDDASNFSMSESEGEAADDILAGDEGALSALDVDDEKNDIQNHVQT